MCIASATASRAQTPRVRGNSAVQWGKRKALYTPPLPASTPVSIPTSIAIDLLLRDTKSWSACKRAQKYSCASRGRASLSASPPLSLNLSARRALPRHLLELSGRHSSSVLHRDCETKRAFGARRLQHQAMPAGDHRAKQSACLGRLLGAGAW